MVDAKHRSALYEAMEIRLSEKVPEFVKMAKATEPQLIVMHQEAFAADLQDEELMLLGMAIKLAGHYGKEVRVIAA
ncbi:MAG: hypothetical protein ACRD8A_07350 [Candidatus Acidiferrales bacterium]